MGCQDVKVFILAGGLGTRIRPLFADLPKVMIPFSGKPFLEIQMQMLADQGFTSFVLCVGHQAERITDYFDDGREWGWNIVYSHEPEPLGTGGALRYAARYLDAPALILNGDTYLPMDYQALIQKHRDFPNRIGTLTVVEMEDTRRYGQVVTDANARIQAFLEKAEAAGQGKVNAGVYVFEPLILHHIPPEGTVSLERDVFPSLLTAGIPLYAYTARQAFIDIGTPEGYQALRAALA
jgi:mannose-1-phosphate guanylyltransferase